MVKHGGGGGVFLWWDFSSTFSYSEATVKLLGNPKVRRAKSRFADTSWIFKGPSLLWCRFWRMWPERSLCFWCGCCPAWRACRQWAGGSSWWSWWWSRPSWSRPSTLLTLTLWTVSCSAHARHCRCSRWAGLHHSHEHLKIIVDWCYTAFSVFFTLCFIAVFFLFYIYKYIFLYICWFLFSTPQKNVHSTRFVTYFCEHVLPNLSMLTSPVAELDIQLEVSIICINCFAFFTW